jgi:hypothetical protein
LKADPITGLETIADAGNHEAGVAFGRSTDIGGVPSDWPFRVELRPLMPSRGLDYRQPLIVYISSIDKTLGMPRA